MKIKQLQGGGFLSFTPFTSASPTTGNPKINSEESSKSENGILDDTTYKFLIDKGGLINDVNSFVSELTKIQSSSTNPFAKSSNIGLSLQIIGKINEMRESKMMWEKALSNAEKEDSLGEVAVGSSGEVYTKDKDNKLIAISVSDYAKNKDSIRLLTNNELLYERQMNPQLTGNLGIINVAGSSIGLNKITDHINKLISAFGTESITDDKIYSKDQVLKELGKYAGKKPTEEEAIAVRKLMDIANTPGELYRVKSENSSEKRQAMKAVKYIWDTLGSSAQKKLTATAATAGKQSPLEFILDMISINTDEKTATEISTVGASGTSGTSGSNGTSSEKPMSQFQMFFKNSLKGVWTDFMVNDPNFGSLFRGAVGSKGPLVDKNDNPIEMSKLSDILSKNQYSSMVDTSKIYFGDKKISSQNFNNVIYNNSEDAGIIFVPVKSDGTPDYDSFKRFNEANQVFEANKSNWNDQQIKNHFKKYSFNVNITTDNDGEKSVKALAESSNVKPFLVMSAYTNDAVEEIVDDNKRITKLNSSELDTLEPFFESIWTIGSGKNTKNLTPTNPFYKFGTPYYKGVVLAPIKLEASVVADALSGQGPKQAPTSINTVKYNIKNSRQQFTGGLNPNISSTLL